MMCSMPSNDGSRGSSSCTCCSVPFLKATFDALILSHPTDAPATQSRQKVPQFSISTRACPECVSPGRVGKQCGIASNCVHVTLALCNATPRATALAPSTNDSSPLASHIGDVPDQITAVCKRPPDLCDIGLADPHCIAIDPGSRFFREMRPARGVVCFLE